MELDFISRNFCSAINSGMIIKSANKVGLIEKVGLKSFMCTQLNGNSASF